METQPDSRRMADNVAEVRRKMAEAARAAGRRPEEILLCAVCKDRSSGTVRLSAALQVDLFGENRVQEFLTHSQASAYLNKPCHFIGHLQTNKVRKLVGRTALIQSVDSLRLLEAIREEAARQGLVQDILVEVNLADEPGKTGLAKEELGRLLDAAAAMPLIRVRGLMAIPPAFDNSPGSRRHFASLRTMLEGVGDRRCGQMPLDTLSMGMTDSYEAAILEGATLVRVGRGIYGERV